MELPAISCAADVKRILGENLRMYLLSTLAHNKGLNIRNEVCHGLWTTAEFTKTASERVLHILLSVSMLRAKPKDGAPAEPGAGS